MFFIFSLILSSHAGIIGDLCAKCLGAWVADAHDEYEGVTTDYLVRTMDALCTAKRWRAFNAYEQTTFDRLTRELKLRSTYGSDADRDRVDETLIRCAH